MANATRRSLRQDLNLVRMRLVDRLGHPRTRVVAVGDPCQAIYGASVGGIRWGGWFCGGSQSLFYKFVCKLLYFCHGYMVWFHVFFLFIEDHWGGFHWADYRKDVHKFYRPSPRNAFLDWLSYKFCPHSRSLWTSSHFLPRLLYVDFSSNPPSMPLKHSPVASPATDRTEARGFTGAAHESLENFTKHLEAKRFPLTITWRYGGRVGVFFWFGCWCFGIWGFCFCFFCCLGFWGFFFGGVLKGYVLAFGRCMVYLKCLKIGQQDSFGVLNWMCVWKIFFFGGLSSKWGCCCLLFLSGSPLWRWWMILDIILLPFGKWHRLQAYDVF